MRIRIVGSARKHGVTDDEIRTVIEFPVIRLAIAPRSPKSVPVLHIGPAAENEPDIEVIADFADPANVVVFHAMMLRPNLGVDPMLTDDEYESLADSYESESPRADEIVGPVEVLPNGRPRGRGPARGRTPTTSVRLPESLRTRLAANADREGVAPSELIRRAVAEYLDRHSA